MCAIKSKMCVTDVQKAILSDKKKCEQVLNLTNMKKAIPKAAFEKSVVKSFYHFVFDYAMWFGSVYALYYLNSSGISWFSFDIPNFSKSEC